MYLKIPDVAFTISARLALAVCLVSGWSAASEPETPRDEETWDDAAARDEILRGREWMETMRAWNRWLALQKIYDTQQVKKMKRQFDDEVKGLSAKELAQFRDDLRAKVHVLMSAEALDARHWLSETLAVASEKYAKKIRAGLPDVANLSAQELQDQLDRFEERRSQTQQGEVAIQQARRNRVKAVQADLRQQHVDSQKAMRRAARDLNAGSRSGNSVPSSIHDRKSFSDQYDPFGFFGGFW
jgi:LPS O-antigen subunit length determinant protein (WzzB/FepE family)